MAEILNKRVFNFYGEIQAPEELNKFINNNEKTLFAIKTFRDAAIITDKKILICDKQGLTDKKVEYFVIPYSKIVTYSIETSGRFDLDSEIKLTLSGGLEIELQFLKDKNMNDLLFKVFKVIDEYVIK